MSKAILASFDQPNPYDSRKVDTLRLVVPLGCVDDPIERLLADISVRFRNFLGKTQDELRFVGLTYAESHVDPTDLIRDIIAPGDAVKVQDEKGWVLAQNNYLKSADLAIHQDSFEEGAESVSCNVGLDTRNKIYIKMYIGNYKSPKRQSLFFIPLPSDSKSSVAPGTGEINAGKGGICHASWAWGEDGKLTIESQVKSSTDPQPMVKRITSSVVDGKFVMGEVTNVQEPFPKITKIYSVPDPNQQGPNLDALLAQKPVEATLSTESTGDVLKIEQVEHIQMSENWKSDDTFYNLIYTPLRFTNAADKPVTITEVSGQYTGKDGELVTMENVFLSMKRGYHDYSRYRTPYNEQIAPESSALYTIEVSIPIKGFPQIDRARRIHSSLPDPFNMNLTVKTSAGQTASIKVTAVNPQLTITTRAEAEKNKSVESFDWWMTCDDNNVMSRVWLGMHHNKENNYLAFHHSLGQGKWIYQKDINEALFLALKDEKREVIIKDLGHQKEGEPISISAFLVVDLECRCGYAIRFNLKTSTSSLDCYRNLPSEI